VNCESDGDRDQQDMTFGEFSVKWSSSDRQWWSTVAARSRSGRKEHPNSWANVIPMAITGIAILATCRWPIGTGLGWRVCLANSGRSSKYLSIRWPLRPPNGHLMC